MSLAKQVVEAVLSEVDLPESVITRVYYYIKKGEMEQAIFFNYKARVFEEWTTFRELAYKIEDRDARIGAFERADKNKEDAIAGLPDDGKKLIIYTLHLLSFFLNVPPLKDRYTGDITTTLKALLPEAQPLPYDVPVSIMWWLEDASFAVSFLDFDVDIDLPLRFEHTHILGSTGSGKTVLLKHLIFKDTKKDATVMVMAPKGDLIPFLLSSPIPKDRILLIRPQDDIALNIFDVDISMLNYVFGSILEADTTNKQTTLLNYCLRLLLHVPNATIWSLRDLMKSPSLPKQYEQYVTELTKAGQEFFDSGFNNQRLYKETKEQVLWRIDLLLENPFIERIFSQPRTNIAFMDALEENKVILIETSIETLGKDGSAFFGRFFIALLNLVSQRRKTDTPIYAYLDEASQYLDSNIESMLELAREAKVGITIAHQQLAQLGELAPTIMSNTHTKIVGGCSLDDSRKIGKEMYVEPERLAKQKTFHFHLWSKGFHSIPIEVNPKYIDSLPKRAPESFYNPYVPKEIHVEEDVPDDDIDSFFAP